jgi:hypothetical protein
MSKVIIKHAAIKDTFPVTAATITTSWKSGQIFTLSSTGEYASLAGSNDAAMFVAIDGPTELSAPPTGSLLTGIYGSGTRFVIDHSAEVAASSTSYAYEADVPNLAINADLYCSASGKWTGVLPVAGSASVLGKVMSLPTAGNNYNLEIKLLGGL